MEISAFLTVTFLFLFGSAVGSFFNVIALRFREEIRIWNWNIIGGRSHCPLCKKTLVWYELIPVFSFLAQRGRCRQCGGALPLQYLLVEIITGAIWVLVPMHVLALMPSAYIAAALYAVVFSLFILLALIDMRLYLIPNEVSLLLAVLGALIVFELSRMGADIFSFLGYYSFLFGQPQNILLNRVLASAVGFLFFGAIVFLTRGKAMGMGDVKFAVPLGIIFGFPDAAVMIALAFVIGALIGIWLLLGGKKHMKDAVPFGPFLVIGATLVFFFGSVILRFLFALFTG